MTALFITLTILAVLITAWSVIERHRRHKRGELQSGDTADALVDGVMIAAIVDDLANSIDD